MDTRVDLCAYAYFYVRTLSAPLPSSLLLFLPPSSSSTHLSLPEKMANYVRALCIHLFVVKTQQGVSSEMGKGSEGEAFC